MLACTSARAISGQTALPHNLLNLSEFLAGVISINDVISGKALSREQLMRLEHSHTDINDLIRLAVYG